MVILAYGGGKGYNTRRTSQNQQHKNRTTKVTVLVVSNGIGGLILIERDLKPVYFPLKCMQEHIPH